MSSATGAPAPGDGMNSPQRRRLLGALAFGLGGSVLAKAGQARAARTFASIPKSLWIWRTPLSASAEAAEIVRRYNFHTVFYSIPPTERPALFEGGKAETGAIRALRAAGVRFYAVAGDPAWTRRGAEVPRAVQNLLAFQERSGLLDGLCLDIEPQALPEWKAGERQGAIDGYLAVLGTISRAARSTKLSLAAAVAPFFVNQPGRSGSMLDDAAALVDETVMMAYRNTPDAALHVSRKALAQLDSAGHPWWFGVSTYQKAKEPDVSYAGTTFDRFSAAMVELDERLSTGHQGYRGIAINDYPSLAAILRT
jgi:hypothetical protein